MELSDLVQQIKDIYSSDDVDHSKVVEIISESWDNLEYSAEILPSLEAFFEQIESYPQYLMRTFLDTLYKTQMAGLNFKQELFKCQIGELQEYIREMEQSGFTAVAEERQPRLIEKEKRNAQLLLEIEVMNAYFRSSLLMRDGYESVVPDLDL